MKLLYSLYSSSIHSQILRLLATTILHEFQEHLVFDLRLNITHISKEKRRQEMSEEEVSPDVAGEGVNEEPTVVITSTLTNGVDRYLVITNISKINNVIQLIHTAAAYDYHPILVASPKIRDSIVSFIHIDYPLIWFPTLEVCKERLRVDGIILVGIEILEGAHSITSYTFPKRIAIMPGNEGSGMNERQIQNCDALVYIPHYGYGTASLNVHVATTLVMQQYHVFHHTLGI